MPDDAPRRRLTIADLRPIDRIATPAQREPPRLPARPVKAPTVITPPPVKAKSPPAAKAKPAKQPKPPARTPEEIAASQRAAKRRQRANHRRNRACRQRAAFWPQAQELLLQLQASYPVTFARGWPKPLATGIHHVILAELGCDPQVLEVALRFWCSRIGYVANVADMTHRYNLDGTPAAELTEAEHANARQQWTAISELLRQRARTQRKPPR